LCISAYLKTFAQTERSFLWHSGVAQPGKKSGFEKRADGCHREKSGGLQAGDARITIVTTQPSDFGEFEGRPFGVSFKRVGGGEPGMTLLTRGDAFVRTRDYRLGTAFL
jgi:hypothetical protein